MWNFNYDSPKAISELLNFEGLSMSKKFGQNFLIDRNVRNATVKLFEMEKNKMLWEIGPGIGSLTALSIESGANVKAFEIDKGFCKILRERAFMDESGFELVQGDALKTVFEQTDRPNLIYGNLPYNVGSVLIGKLIEEEILVDKMVFTLQKEVVERMSAKVGDENWSFFSILTQIDYENKLEFTIGKGCFYPAPTVESAVVSMKKREEPLVPPSIRDIFINLTRDLFSQRRKTVKNNLLNSFFGKTGGRKIVDQVLETSEIDGAQRAEKLSFDALIKLARTISML